MSKQPASVRLRGFWNRIEWNPLFVGAVLFLPFVILGLGSARSLIVGTGLGLLGAVYAKVWTWSCKNVKAESKLRMINAASSAVLWVAGIEGGRWMARRSDSVGAAVTVVIALILIAPIRYSQDLPYPKSREQSVDQNV